MEQPQPSQISMEAVSKVVRELLERANLKEHRCHFCGVLVFKGDIPKDGVVQINCPRDRCDQSRRHMPPEQRFLTFASL